MKKLFVRSGNRSRRPVAALVAAMLLLMTGASWGSGAVAATPSVGTDSQAVTAAGRSTTFSAGSIFHALHSPFAPQVTCPGGQCFEDVPPTNTFFTFINNLYLDGIIGGYACVPGGPADPCVPPDNRPYYHPVANVTRSQMAKFVDNGRRNIANAVGTSLVISGTAYNTLDVRTNSGGSAIVGTCLTPATACYAVAGGAPAGDFAGYFAGGRGVYAGSQDAMRPALDTVASGSTAVGVNAFSQLYRGANTARNNTAFFTLSVDKMSGESPNDLITHVAASV
jgi:hypothetical protein